MKNRRSLEEGRFRGRLFWERRRRSHSLPASRLIRDESTWWGRSVRVRCFIYRSVQSSPFVIFFFFFRRWTILSLTFLGIIRSFSLFSNTINLSKEDLQRLLRCIYKDFYILISQSFFKNPDQRNSNSQVAINLRFHIWSKFETIF